MKGNAAEILKSETLDQIQVRTERNEMSVEVESVKTENELTGESSLIVRLSSLRARLSILSPRNQFRGELIDLSLVSSVDVHQSPRRLLAFSHEGVN